MCEELLPLCDLITPNTHEARHLSNKSESATMEECARHLLAFGAGSVLIRYARRTNKSRNYTPIIHTG
ncbi:MAG: hydroxymethylpyrimidine/phosphomethylpyrimidine kinase [Candidatus Thiodiazotropha sp. (ex Semelilucina semeliformis)]|nr:hydroxymethylpyrimidine/phosphomethylpyrimidine kinase [Candidatus Thiodiazotropha sp. (ex Semelilucina semeliformis)]